MLFKSNNNLIMDSGTGRQTKRVEHSLKILMLGDSGAGKTSLLVRFSQNAFNPAYITTIGIDILNKKINLADQVINLKIWDTAGQERYQTLTKQFFVNVDGIVLVLNLLSLESFKHLEKWLDLIKNQGEQQNLDIIIAGNKCDCDEDEKAVEPKDIETFVEANNLIYLETSAKTGINVEKLFQTLTKRILKRKGIKLESRQSIMIHQQPKQKKRKCC